MGDGAAEALDPVGDLWGQLIRNRLFGISISSDAAFHPWQRSSPSSNLRASSSDNWAAAFNSSPGVL